MRRAVRVRFIREQRRVNAAVDHPRAARAYGAADLIATARVAGVDADADDIARRNGLEIERLQRFIDDDRIAPGRSCGGCQHIQPSRRDDGHAKREVARIHKVDSWRHLNLRRQSIRRRVSGRGMNEGLCW